MKIELFADITASRNINEWVVILIPTIALKRSDAFAEEACRYIIFHFLVFQICVRIITKKKSNETAGH